MIDACVCIHNTAGSENNMCVYFALLALGLVRICIYGQNKATREGIFSRDFEQGAERTIDVFAAGDIANKGIGIDRVPRPLSV